MESESSSIRPRCANCGRRRHRQRKTLSV